MDPWVCHDMRISEPALFKSLIARRERQKVRHLRRLGAAERILFKIRGSAPKNSPSWSLSPLLQRIIIKRHPDSGKGPGPQAFEWMADYQVNLRMAYHITAVFKPQHWCQSGVANPYSFRFDIPTVEVRKRYLPELFVQHNTGQCGSCLFGTECHIYYRPDYLDNVARRLTNMLLDSSGQWLESWNGDLAKTHVFQGYKVIIEGIANLLRRPPAIGETLVHDNDMEVVAGHESKDRRIALAMKEIAVNGVFARKTGDEVGPSRKEWMRMLEVNMGKTPPCPVCGEIVIDEEEGTE